MKQTTIKLPDDFCKGDCRNCPFSYRDWCNDGGVYCSMGYWHNECPLVITEVKEDNNGKLY